MELTPEQLANQKVEDYIIERYRAGEESTFNFNKNVHLQRCPDLRATPTEARDGNYGCDTGCEYTNLEAVLHCPHGETMEYVYGDFGELSGILEDMGLTDLD